jgi:lysophospholipase L1-like esterase
MTTKWGGKMYFVYLPPFYRYHTGNEIEYRKEILRTAAELNIPILDIHKEVFKSHDDPLSLFAQKRGGHYTAEGYRLIAEAIDKKLKEDKIIP